MDGKIRVGVIAAGGRSRNVVSYLLRDGHGNIELKAVYDPDRAEAEGARDFWNAPACRIAASYQEVTQAADIDWVMVFSPNAFHREHIEDALAAGKHVFTEKPLASTLEDCEAIYRAHKAHPDRLFATGFVLRYSHLYREAKQRLDSGELGELLAIQANENITPEHGGYIMSNWRRQSGISGPHILEKCCHDLDLINWFCGSLPSRVASFGSRRFFVPENEPLMRKYGRETFTAWRDPHAAESPFTSDKDLLDRQVAIAEYRNGILVNFCATMSNPRPERRMLFCCSEGTMVLELYTGSLIWHRMGEKTEREIRFGCDGHGGGDDFIMKDLYRSMSEGTVPACGGNEGLNSAVFALKLDEAARSGAVLDLEPLWKKLGR